MAQWREGQKCWWRVSTPPACLHRSSVDGKRLPDHAWAACRRRALVVHSSASSGVLAELRGQNKRAHLGHRREPGADWGRARCAPRARGRLSRTVASSLAREDHTTTPRWRATARIILFSRERPVSRFGQKNQKSATCKPSTLRRTVSSRPPHRQRSACTSLPRRPRTRHWKWAG